MNGKGGILINNQQYYSHKFLEDFLLANLNKKNIIREYGRTS